MNSIFSQKDIEYLKLHYSDMKYLDIANNLGFTERQIRGKINNLGLTKLRKFNTLYFHNINSSTKAYFLGFIYADGYLVQNKENRNYELGLEIDKKDISLLEHLNKELGNCHKITFSEKVINFNGYTYKTHTCILRIYSKQIVSDLISINIVPNKTIKQEFPTCDNYFFDFLRGFLDGDGCISINKRGYIRIHFVNSNNEFLLYLKSMINKFLDIDGVIYKEKENKYQLTYFRQNDIKILLDAIYQYEKCECLQRKYNIYKSYYGSTI